MAKCIQDGRRVDLPLSRPFFKLMCSTAKHQTTPPDHVTQSESEEHPSPTHEEAESLRQSHVQQPDTNNINEDENENSAVQSNQMQSGSSIGNGNGTASATRVRNVVGAGLKEAELLATAAQVEICKDGSGKDVLTLEEISSTALTTGSTVPWFNGILDNEDFAEVNPFRAKFLQQLDDLMQQRDSVMEDKTLEAGEREKRLAAITLPGEQENIPGVKIDDLWYVKDICDPQLTLIYYLGGKLFSREKLFHRSVGSTHFNVGWV